MEDNGTHVTRSELDAILKYIDERFRAQTWKLAAVAFAGGIVGNTASPVVGASLAAVGLLGVGVKAVLAALLRG